jgi:hypothetical protein
VIERKIRQNFFIDFSLMEETLSDSLSRGDDHKDSSSSAGPQHFDCWGTLVDFEKEMAKRRRRLLVRRKILTFTIIIFC